MRMVIDKICKMTVKGVRSKSESFFSISRGVLELWRKNLRGGFRPPPPGLDRVNKVLNSLFMFNRNLIETSYPPVVIHIS